MFPSTCIPHTHRYADIQPVAPCLQMTSFGDRPLQVRYPKPRHAAKRAHYLPVAPAPAHPDTAAHLPLLHLADPARMAMRKDSYINIERPYHGIPLAILRPFHGRHGPGITLDAVSYQLVLKHAGFAPPSTELLGVSVPSPPPRRNPSHVPLLDDGDCRIDMDHLRQGRPVHHHHHPPPPSYGTVPPVSRPRRRSPVRSTARGARGEASLGSYSDGAAGPSLHAGFVAGAVQCVLWASVLFLVGYGGYLGVVKTVEGLRLFGAWVRSCVGAVGDAARGAFRGVHDSIASAGDGVRGAWEAVVGWVRRAVGSLRF